MNAYLAIERNEGDVFLSYDEVAEAFSLDAEFHAGCREVWSLVRSDIGGLNRFMQDGIVSLQHDDSKTDQRSVLMREEGEREAQRSVQTWLRGDADQAWLNDCHDLITRHVGKGAPTLSLSGLKTRGNLFLIEMLRLRCRDMDHFMRLTKVMATLSSVQDAIIAYTHQQHLRSLMRARLHDHTERLREEVAGVVAEVNGKSRDLRGRIEELSRFTQATVLNNREIAQISDKMVSAMHDAADLSTALMSGIEQAKVKVSGAASVAGSASRNAQDAVEAAAGLAAHTDAISSILQFIRDVASQTNLLALNAAIEAARAGEMGRGFAIVAQEVKALAGQTAQAAGQIAEQIGSIQSSARTAMSVMTIIHKGVSKVFEETDSVSLAMEKQAQGASGISHSLTISADSAAATSRKLLEMGSATEIAASQLVGTDKAFYEIADHLQILDERVNLFIGAISGEDEALAS